MRARTQLIAALLAGALPALCPVQAYAGSPASYTFNLPAQNLGDALRAVAAQAGLELYASADDVNRTVSRPLQGTYTAREAIAALLEGTDLTARFSDGAVVIRGPGKTDGADAGDVTTSAIVVTGTRIRGQVPSAPVRTASRKEIEEQGLHDLGGFIRSIPENFTGGQNPGVAGGGNQGSGNENSSSSSALNLRGLGPAATLTLLNGHRMAYDTVAQGVDISQIRLAAIDRVEILTDGSSALYGSDAVGGVANVILRRDYQGAQVSARLAGSTDGGNFQQQYGLLTGSRWGSGGIMLAGSYYDVTAITARDRDYTSGLDDSATLVPWQRQYSLIAAGHQDITSRLALEFDGQYNKRDTELSAPFLTTSDVTTSGLLSRPAVRSATGSATLRWDVGSSWTLTATGVYGFSNNHIVSRRYFGGAETLRSWLNYDNDVATGEVGGEGVLFNLPGGEARLALGAGYRHIGLDVLVRQNSGGATSVTRDIRSGREVWFGYGELSLPLVGEANAMPFVRRLQLDLAARYEDYPHTAQLMTPKIGFVFSPGRALTFKGSWGKSFKTQTLYQQYQNRQGVLLPSIYFPGAPSDLPVLILAGGNPGLKPEKATTWSVGVKITPPAMESLELEANWFDIRYRDRVVSPIGSLLSVFSDPIYADYVTFYPAAADVAAAVADLPQGLSNQTGAAFDPAAVSALVDGSLQNAARQHVYGLDLAARYKLDLGRAGLVRLEGSASYLKSNQMLSEGYPLQQLAGTIFNPPHWRGRMTATWQKDNVTLSVLASHTGGTTDDRLTQVRHVGSFTTLGLTAQIRSLARSGLASGIDFTLSLQNLLNEKPATIVNSSPVDPPYDSTNTSVAGRVISIGISKAL